MRYFKITFLILILYFGVNYAWSMNFLDTRIPGGIAVLSIGQVQTDHNQKIINKPKVTFQGRKVAVLASDNNWYALVGLSLKLKPNRKYYAKVIQKGKTRNYLVKVQYKKYPEQRITIKNQRMVVPNKLDLKRIKAESKLIRNAKLSWQDQPLKLNFFRPLEGKLISKFGLKRFFNDQPRSPHSGIDIPAPLGTPIYSISSGKVILTGDFFFNGKTVLISHGQGVVSLYCHMNEIAVDKNELVTPDSVIGEVCSTGRATGPHLHMSLYFNGAAVDPEIFLDYQGFEKSK